MNSKARCQGKEGDGKPANEIGENEKSHPFCNPVKLQKRDVISFL